MKRVYRIVPYLILFVIFPARPSVALDFANLFRFSTCLHFVKEQRFDTAIQPGYSISEGIELSTGSGMHIGAAGTVGHLAPSFVKDGVSYRGFASLGGEIIAGYLHPETLLHRVRIGIFGFAGAEYARYFATDLIFFYLTAGAAPAVSVQLAGNVAFRFSFPVRYNFRRDLSYHLYFGLASTFLIG